MNEERKMILQMLSDGKINVDEAERLLDALHGDKSGGAGRPFFPIPPISPRRLHIIVSENGDRKADMRLPIGLARAGLKVGKSFTAFSGRLARDAQDTDYVLELMESIDIDEIIESLQDGTLDLPHTIINADDKGRNVQIILE